MQVRRFDAAWHGFAVSIRKPENPAAEYWALAPARGGWRMECAAMTVPADWTAYARALLGIGEAELLAYHDAARGRHRFAAFAGDRFLGALFVGPEPVAVARGWLAGLLRAPHLDARARLAVLAGQAGDAAPDQGPIVCACFEVGRHRIAAAVAAGHRNVAAIGAATTAGTNCGSCRAEIMGIIDASTLAHAV